MSTNANARRKTGSRMEQLKFVGASKLMKELQKTVFFAAYDSIFSSGNSITEKQQKQLLRDSILGTGNPNYVSLPEQMVAGINQFAGLYEDVGMLGSKAIANMVEHASYIPFDDKQWNLLKTPRPLHQLRSSSSTRSSGQNYLSD